MPKERQNAVLVERCCRGDRHAWEQLVTSYTPIVSRFLRRLGVPDWDLEDTTQEVFVQLITSLKRYRGEAKLSTWLYRVASNVAWKRRRGASRRLGLANVYREAVGRTVRSESVDQPALEARDELRQVQAAVERLKPKLRTVWVMVELEGLDHSDVADALKLPAGTVRSRLHQARRQVLDSMAKQHAKQPPTLRVLRGYKGDGR